MNTPNSPEQGRKRVEQLIERVIQKAPGNIRGQIRTALLAVLGRMTPHVRTGNDQADTEQAIHETPAEVMEALKKGGVNIADISMDNCEAIDAILGRVYAGTSSPDDPKLADQLAAIFKNPKMLREMVFGRQEPIRKTGDCVGRNDPCPCGSGKKFKICHMRTETR